MRSTRGISPKMSWLGYSGRMQPYSGSVLACIHIPGIDLSAVLCIPDIRIPVKKISRKRKKFKMKRLIFLLNFILKSFKKFRILFFVFSVFRSKVVSRDFRRREIVLKRKKNEKKDVLNK